MNIFGYKFIKKEELKKIKDQSSTDQLERVRVQNNLREAESALNSLSSLEKPIPLDAFLKDPVPDDTEERKMYVAKVAGLHTEILRSKLEHMISGSANCLKDWANDTDMDMKLKGVIYALEEIIRWGDAMVNEQIANQIEDKED